MPTPFARRAALQVALAAAARSALAAPPPIKRWRHYAQGRFGQVHFVSAAPAEAANIKRAPLVCCHASPFSGDTFRDLQDVLATDRIVHCVDTPGYGNSESPPQKPTMADYGGAIADAIADLGYGRGQNGQVDMFGDHTGALCAAEVAVQRPELVRRMALSGVPHFDTAAAREEFRRKNVVHYPYFDDPSYVANLYRQSVLEAVGAGAKERLLTNFADRVRAGPNGWWGPDAVFTTDSGATLRALDKPILLIVFNELMTQQTRDAAKVLRRAETVEMPQLPIFGFMVAPEAVAQVLRTFLDAYG